MVVEGETEADRAGVEALVGRGDGGGGGRQGDQRGCGGEGKVFVMDGCCSI